MSKKQVAQEQLRKDLERSKELLTDCISKTNPVRRAAVTYSSFVHKTDQDLADTTVDIATECAKVERGDMRRMENMLVAQAHALDSIFHRLAQRASTSDHLPTFEALMRMGLRAQGQSRSCIEALNELKNPRAVAFVHQANIAGNQQVNNGTSTLPGPLPRASVIENEPSKLLEASNVTRLDTRAASQAGRSHPPLEAVERVHRAKVARRKAAS